MLDGLEVRVAFGGVWKESLTELSGGQRSLVALSLILSLVPSPPSLPLPPNFIFHPLSTPLPPSSILPSLPPHCSPLYIRLYSRPGPNILVLPLFNNFNSF